MSEQPLVSVVIPAYNAERFLKEAVESLRDQTYRNLEIIIVNDGSKDSTKALCDRFVAADNRIHAIHQDNQGPSAAKNRGVDESHGDFLMFLDADDVLDSDAVAACLDAYVEHPAGLLLFRYRRMDEQGRLLPNTEESLTYPSGLTMNAQTALKHLLLGDFQNYAWCWFVPRATWECEAVPLRFDDNIVVLEDAELFPRLILSAGTVHFMPQILHSYRLTSGSLMTSIDVVRSINAQSNMRDVRASILTAYDSSLEPYCESDRYMFELHIVCRWLRFHADDLAERQRWLQAERYVRCHKVPALMPRQSNKARVKHALVRMGFARWFR